jgi:hypothetical protein
MGYLHELYPYADKKSLEREVIFLLQKGVKVPPSKYELINERKKIDV